MIGGMEQLDLRVVMVAVPLLALAVGWLIWQTFDWLEGKGP